MADSSFEQKQFRLMPVKQAVMTACGASVAVTAAPAVMAQEQVALEEIVVTARKRAENLQDVPVSVQAFSADAIAKQGITGLADYARLIPSLTYSSWLPGNSIVVFRGVTVTADAFSGDSSAAMFFNDMPITVQGLNPEVSTVDMQRIEAVSGPQPTFADIAVNGSTTFTWTYLASTAGQATLASSAKGGWRTRTRT